MQAFDSEGFQSLSIQVDEMEYLLDLTKGKYPHDIIVLTHVALMLVPRLKEIGIFRPVLAITHPKFRVSSKEVAIACRLISMCRYGMMFSCFLKQNGFDTDEDMNRVLLAMYQLKNKDSCCLLQKWEMDRFDFKKAFNDKEGLLCPGIFTETEFSEMVMRILFSREITTLEEFDFKDIDLDSEISAQHLSIQLQEEMGAKESPFLLPTPGTLIEDFLTKEIQKLTNKITDAYKKKKKEDEDESGLLE